MSERVSAEEQRALRIMFASDDEARDCALRASRPLFPSSAEYRASIVRELTAHAAQKTAALRVECEGQRADIAILTADRDTLRAKLEVAEAETARLRAEVEKLKGEAHMWQKRCDAILSHAAERERDVARRERALANLATPPASTALAKAEAAVLTALDAWRYKRVSHQNAENTDHGPWYAAPWAEQRALLDALEALDALRASEAAAGEEAAVVDEALGVIGWAESRSLRLAMKALYKADLLRSPARRRKAK